MKYTSVYLLYVYIFSVNYVDIVRYIFFLMFSGIFYIKDLYHWTFLRVDLTMLDIYFHSQLHYWSTWYDEESIVRRKCHLIIDPISHYHSDNLTSTSDSSSALSLEPYEWVESEYTVSDHHSLTK